MKKIILNILKENILLDNYMHYNECPITKALQRAGHVEAFDMGSINGRINGEEVYISSKNNASYKELLTKLYGMYNSFTSNGGEEYLLSGEIIPEPIEVEDFTAVIEY